MKMMLGNKKMWLWWLPLMLVVGTAAVYNNPNLNKYHAYVSPWTSCQESPSTRSMAEKLVFTPRLGTQMRQVICRDSRGRQVEDFYCSKAYNSVPKVRTCIIPEDCQLGNETDWFPFGENELIKYKEIIKLPHGGGAPCGQVQTVNKAQLDPVPGSTWIKGPWGDCIVHLNNHEKKINLYPEKLKAAHSITVPEISCGGGTARRTVICVDKNGKPLFDSQCEYPPPSIEEPCEKPCPRDCKVDNWSEWGPCSLIDGHSVVRTRKRRVLEGPTELGVQCPHLEEVRQCYETQPRWRTGPWGDCLLNSTNYGKGMRTRIVSCTHDNGRDVDERFCHAPRRPDSTEVCYVTSTGDRILSQWSPWSKCDHDCAVSRNDKPMQTRYQYVLSFGIIDIKNKFMESHIASIEKRPCNIHSCNIYSWLPLHWNCNCTAEYRYKHKDDMQKNVLCMNNRFEAVGQNKCNGLRMGRTSPCRESCDRECRSTNWGDFSPCPMSCGDYYTERRRSKLYPDKPGCVPYKETKPCPMYTSCKRALWYTSSWSSCVFPPDYPCGLGYKIRSVWCGTEEYEKINPSYCAGKAMPETSRRCFNNDSCDMNQAMLTCDTICKDPLKYMDIEVPECHCNNVVLHPSNFSACFMPERSTQICGSGYRIAASYCTINNTHVPLEVCKKFHPSESIYYDSLYTEWTVEPCEVQCPIDCSYGEWSHWGPCVGVKNTLSAMRKRTREVFFAMTDDGRPCRITEQTSNCTAIRPRWSIGEWEPCTPLINYCGETTISRIVNCVDYEGNMVPEEQCLHFDPMPDTSMLCHAACPQDCMTSEWSEWSPCEMSSWGYRRRDRTRVILRERIEAMKGIECGRLVESSKCTDTYSWYYGPWADCVPLGTSDCGEGMKMRDVRCINDKKEFVEDSFCSESNVTKLPETTWCYIDCGINCGLSAWSAWDKTNCTCGLEQTGEMTRYRRVVVPQKWPGRSCRHLIENAPCPRVPCAGAMISASDKCVIVDNHDNEKGDEICGAGHMTLTNLCELLPATESSRKMDVPLTVCYKSPPGQLTVIPPRLIEEECAIPCKCHNKSPIFTPWSEWSACNGLVRSRKRTLLPGDRDMCHINQLQLSVEWTTCSPYHAEITLNGAIDKGTPQKQHSTQYVFLWFSGTFTMLYGMYYIIRFVLMWHRNRNDKKPSSV